MKAFLNSISLLPDDMKSVLSKIPEEICSRINEIRLRSGEPVVLNGVNEMYFVTENGRTTAFLNDGLLTCDTRKLQEAVFYLSRRSIHTYQDMIAKGFIPLQSGCKAGVVGCAVIRNGCVYSVSSFNSVNIRVSREHKGCARELINSVGGCYSYLVVGQPLSGKTTLLRDLCRTYGGNEYKKKIAVVDERDEIGSRAFGSGVCLGLYTDVLSLYPKAVGCDIALRTLSPDIIVLDEIGSYEETEMLLSSMNSGISVIATAHGADLSEILRKPNLKKLIDGGVFKKAVILNGKEKPCSVKEVVSL